MKSCQSFLSWRGGEKEDGEMKADVNLRNKNAALSGEEKKKQPTRDIIAFAQ